MHSLSLALIIKDGWQYILMHDIVDIVNVNTIVWEIFVRDNLAVKFIRCVIFSW